MVSSRASSFLETHATPAFDLQHFGGDVDDAAAIGNEVRRIQDTAFHQQLRVRRCRQLVVGPRPRRL